MDSFTQVFLLLWIQKSSLVCYFFLLMFLQFFSFVSAHGCRAFQNLLQNVKWLLGWWLQASPPFVMAKKMYLFALFYHGSKLIAIASSTWKEQLWNLTNWNDQRTQLPSSWTGNSQEISLSSFSRHGVFYFFSSAHVNSPGCSLFGSVHKCTFLQRPILHLKRKERGLLQ